MFVFKEFQINQQSHFLSLPTDKMAANTAGESWTATGNPLDRDRGMSLRDDFGRNNSTIAIGTLHPINENNDGPFRTIEMDGGQTRTGIIRNYTVTMNRHGILCDCPHTRTCKHCINVLYYHVGVPRQHLLSTEMIKQYLSQYFDSRFIVISD